MNKYDTKYIEYVWKYLEGELSGEELKIFKDELKTNPRLFSTFVEQSEIYEAISKTETIELRKQLQTISITGNTSDDVKAKSGNIHTLWYLAAASLVIIISLGYLVYHFAVKSMDPQLTDHKTANDKMITNNSIKSEKNVQQIPLDTSVFPPSDSQNENVFVMHQSDNYFSMDTERDRVYKEWMSVVYQENPMLEQLLDINYRSDLMDIYLPEPDQSYTLDDTVVFYWKPELDTSVYLTIINNRSVEVYHSRLKGKQLIIYADFSPGLYYWRIDTEKDNILSGRFVVENE